MQYTTLLFDLDGTLTDPYEGITNAIAYALRVLERPCPDGHTLRKFIGPPLLESLSGTVRCPPFRRRRP
jgi:phosphoglycolate phosphatase